MEKVEKKTYFAFNELEQYKKDQKCDFAFKFFQFQNIIFPETHNSW